MLAARGLLSANVSHKLLSIEGWHASGARVIIVMERDDVQLRRLVRRLITYELAAGKDGAPVLQLALQAIWLPSGVSRPHCAASKCSLAASKWRLREVRASGEGQEVRLVQRVLLQALL